MKLKKIASLALAGIMAVSMLAGCKGNGSSSSEGTVVTPVDTSLAAYINNEMTDEQKNLITFSSDAEVQAAIEKIANGMDTNQLSTTNTWLGVTSAAAEAFSDLVGAKYDGFATELTNSNEDITESGIYVIPGNMTEDAMKKQVYEGVKVVLSPSVLPVANTYNGDYLYSYAGKIAATKVVSADGQRSAYVVGVVIEKTVTERA